MIRRFAALGVSAAIVLGASSPAMAGGWTQEPQEYYVKMGVRSLIGNRAFSIVDPGTAVGLPGTFHNHSLQVYAEYGLKERLSIVGFTTPLGFASMTGNRVAYTGASWAGVRYQLYRSGRWSFCGQLTAGGRPHGDRSLFDEQIDGQRVVVRPTLSTGQVDGELQLGRGFRKGWMSLHLGGRGWSNRAFLPAVSGYAQFGWKPKEHLVFDLHFPVYQSIGEQTELDVLGVTNTRYIGFGLTGSVWVTERFGLTASFEGAAFGTSNAGTPALGLGIELR